MSPRIPLVLAALLLSAASPAAEPLKHQIGFSPCWEGRVCALDLVLQAIDQAKPRQRLWMAAYGLTSKPIEAALITAHHRGADVRIVADEKSNRRNAVIHRLLAAGVPVRFSDRYAIMHNKFMVIGSDTVETGSFNFTASAAKRNAENVMVIRGEPKIAKQYADEWLRLWEEAGPIIYPSSDNINNKSIQK